MFQRPILIGLLFLMTSCLHFDPLEGGGVVYNFCEYPIEWRSDNIPEHYYKNNQHKKIIYPNETKYISFTIRDNLVEEQNEDRKNSILSEVKVM
ncbi:hypothetical protein F9B74_04425 [Pelistega sp. NLN82]|uniref:Lipoprotein n=1 Tax=Pelistega ratti TaxID=2652177 RepID=A0A6L9Y6Z1_9BURK|nr:hypothetical protein [Pelistega ratti]NEN75574.1 hypothetical protein [Pelistega ratti]